MLAADYDMPPLMLTPAELEAVTLGAQWVASRGDPSLATAAQDVLAKIAAAVPARLRPFVAEPSTAAEPQLDRPGERVDLAVLRGAIRRGLKLRLAYRSEAGEQTERVVWPVVLGYADTRRVLIAWCELREGFRHFRTDRMGTIDVLDQPIGGRRGPLRRPWEAWRAAELARTGLTAGSQRTGAAGSERG